MVVAVFDLGRCGCRDCVRLAVCKAKVHSLVNPGVRDDTARGSGHSMDARLLEPFRQIFDSLGRTSKYRCGTARCRGRGHPRSG